MNRLLLIIALITATINVFATGNFNLNGGDTGYRILSSDEHETRIEYVIGSYHKAPVLIDGIEYFHVSLAKEGISQDKGKPQLPVYNRSVIIPNSSRMEVEVYDIQYTDIQILVAPSKGVITRDINPADVPYSFSDIYRENMFYPGNIVTLSEPYIMRDYRGITIQTNPMAYNPVSKTLRIYTSFKVRVFSNGTDDRNNLSRFRDSISRAFLPIYENHFINFNLHRYVPVDDSYGKLLIICHSNFLTQIAPYVSWKKQKGIETELIEWSSIGTTAAQLQTYIQNRYNTDNTLTYVQIVGDAPQIPTLTSGNSGADPMFSLVAGSDNYPDIFIGRFSAETSAQVTAQVNKTITYERDLSISDTWLSRAMGIASNEGGGSLGDNGESDIQHMNLIRTKLLNYGYTSVDQIYDPGASATTVTANVNAGRGFINYVGHGSDTSWSTTGFNNANATSLTNVNKTPVIMDVACVNGNFVSITCFAEAWLRNPNGGAVTMYASTINQSWNSPMRAQDEFTDLLVAESKFTAGGLYYNSSCKMMDIYGNTTGSDGVNMFRTWTIFGDASLLVRSKTPQSMSVNHPGTILIGNSAVNVSTGVANSLVALTYNNAIYARGYTNSMGHATLSLVNPPQVAMDYTITVTAHNRVTYIGSIQQIPGAGPHLVVNSSLYADATNSIPEYNDTGWFNISIQNTGTESASNINLVLSTSTPGISVTNPTEIIASLDPGITTILNPAFGISISGDIANGTVASFDLTMSSGTETWEHSFTMVVNSPSVSFGSMQIYDSSGNNNGRLDPGETADIHITLSNSGGSASVAGSAIISCTSPGITINTGSISISPINSGANILLTFNVTVNSDVSIGSVVSFVFSAQAGMYSAEKTEVTTIGVIIEDFESGSFSSFPWTFSGDLPWTIDNTVSHTGSFSAKSGAITHSQTTSMETTRVLTTPGTLSFWYKVSSESSYDYLKFYIDGVLQNSPGWSGEVNWTQASYNLAVGTKVLKWEYYKDGSVSTNSDCAWIDDIVFPASHVPSNLSPVRNLIAVPGNGFVHLSWNAPISGHPSAYKVFRNNSLIASVTALDYTDTDVLNDNTYTYYVVASYNGTNNGDSDPSDVVQATPSANPIVEVIIGTGTASQSYPIDRYYNYSTHEAIYLASEISNSGMIRKLAFFKGSGTDTNLIDNVSIYMKHTTASSLSNGSYSLEGYTLVFNGSFPNSSGSGWMEVDMNNPYNYNGTSNLSVLIIKGYQAWISNYPQWRYSTTTTSRARQERSDTLQPTSLTSSTYLPNIRFVIQPQSEPYATISVNPSSISENIDAGNSVTKDISITNTGTEALTWQIQDQRLSIESTIETMQDHTMAYETRSDESAEVRLASWCSVQTSSGSIQPGQSFSLALSIDTAGLADGNYSTSINIISNALNNPNLSIPVNIVVQTPVNPYPVQPRFVAEFEPAKGAVIRYPVGLPYTMIRELASDDLLYVIVSSSNQSAAQSVFTSNSINMSNVRWIVAASDSYWVRDYGPWFIFNADNDMQIVDFVYNRPRPNDNAIPQAVANNMGLGLYSMELTQTGGNIMTDGYGMAASTNLVVSENSSLSTAQIEARMHNYLGITDYQLYQDPNNTYIDHIDCWAKLLDVDKVLIRSVPQTHAQYNQIESVVADFASKTSSWGTPYRIYRVYTPNNEPYTNAFILNKKIFVPQKGTTNDSAALQVYSDAMPGYSVFGYTYSNFESTDAIHCRVNTIPDEYMIHIRHTPVSDIPSNQDIALSMMIQNHFNLDQNHTYVSWKHSSVSSWQQTSLQQIGGREWSVSIPVPEFGDTLFYAINATDDSGRTTTLPLSGIGDPFIIVVDQVGTLSKPVLSINKSTDGIILTWNPIPGALRYNVFRSDEPDGTFIHIGTTDSTTLRLFDTSRTGKAFFKVKASTQSN